ncbi:uncharacterized protein F4817DRAFT_347634 [Daldinia loculata]|uniref:uncharacterized protein n=1 Tax=Daldinia loculata TaxID=103429 RepID=UPI0020C3FF93|nr:uncharacterized protein F4817DRAFT_347634 [Daldinia loculata]KAI1644094.1 hypothetical protein F4817DRAFT_347634 [Daldinia loculata]
MPSSAMHSSTSNRYMMSNLNVPDTPRRQQLIRRSRSADSAFLQPTRTRESNTTPIIMQEITCYGHMNIMPQGIMQGVGYVVLNQEGSSPSIPSLVFVGFIISALGFLLLKLLE